MIRTSTAKTPSPQSSRAPSPKLSSPKPRPCAGTASLESEVKKLIGKTGWLALTKLEKSLEGMQGQNDQPLLLEVDLSKHSAYSSFSKRDVRGPLITIRGSERVDEKELLKRVCDGVESKQSWYPVLLGRNEQGCIQAALSSNV